MGERFRLEADIIRGVAESTMARDKVAFSGDLDSTSEGNCGPDGDVSGIVHPGSIVQASLLFRMAVASFSAATGR